jgi:beta-lactam-binding protein with PASTA domain
MDKFRDFMIGISVFLIAMGVIIASGVYFYVNIVYVPEIQKDSMEKQEQMLQNYQNVYDTYSDFLK